MVRVIPRRIHATILVALAGLVCAMFAVPPAHAASTQGGVVSFTFDDGKITQYTNARPALNAAGIKGTFYMISDALTWGSTNM
ncbi:MAG: polysaccharide deacetylase family protein, partial [Kineosporiaceae bacterium]